MYYNIYSFVFECNRSVFLTFKLTVMMIFFLVSQLQHKNKNRHLTKGTRAGSITIMKYKLQGVNHEIYCTFISQWLLRLPIALQLYC